MSERKLVIVTDFNIYAPPASFGDQLIDLLSDLPDYVCLVFYFDILEAKPDKRTKMYKLLEKKACTAEFARLEEKELIERLERRARELNCIISDEDAAYMIFLCGTSLTNLMGEIEKAAAHCTTGEIKRYNIDAVCSPVLDAVVFDLTDAIAAGRFEKAVALVGDLLRLKNNEVIIFTTIMRHIQRLYAAKICAETRGGDRYLSENDRLKIAVLRQKDTERGAAASASCTAPGGFALCAHRFGAEGKCRRQAEADRADAARHCG